MSSQILLYHGVTKYKSFGIENYSKKHISKKKFEKQMKFLNKNINVVPLKEIRNKKNSVAITFDDTFKNVCDVALPILKKYNLPATFFISTGFIGKKKNFWVDKLEMYINFSTIKKVKVFFKSKIFSINTQNNKNKIRTINLLKKFLKTQKPKIRDDLLNKLRKILKPKKIIYAKNYKTLNWSDVKKLHSPPFYEVGGHTVNHEILSYLDNKAMKYEIRECLKQLRTRVSNKIDLFSYPEGQKAHYNKKVIQYLKKNKVSMCPSAIYGIVTNKDDNFNIKRKMVGFNGLPFPIKT